MDFIKDTTEYIFLQDEPTEADIIFIPGSSNPDLPLRAAQLYRDGYAPYVAPSGRYSIKSGVFGGNAQTLGREYETECEFYIDVLQRHGVPRSAIIAEDESTYTYQNAMFTKRATDDADITVRRALLVCKAFHARRACTYYQRVYKDAELLVTPVVSAGITRENWYKTEVGRRCVMGELSRLGEQMGEYAEELARQAECV